MVLLFNRRGWKAKPLGRWPSSYHLVTILIANILYLGHLPDFKKLWLIIAQFLRYRCGADWVSQHQQHLSWSHELTGTPFLICMWGLATLGIMILFGRFEVWRGCCAVLAGVQFSGMRWSWCVSGVCFLALRYHTRIVLLIRMCCWDHGTDRVFVGLPLPQWRCSMVFLHSWMRNPTFKLQTSSCAKLKHRKLWGGM